MLVFIKYSVANIFNFFSELKEKCGVKLEQVVPYNIVNIGGEIVYIEGHKGLLKLSSETISCKLRSGYVEVKGNNMFLKELTENTILIRGKIYKTEVF
ncbi:MAG: YabP/YqfC family sporulation protein [Clostridia bacterium]|nr:YabP/YqfC family sporulation protein [Clostridia bacterium]MBR5226709.1 YabP/YqfC family sporulation protein [Clostridia bacterium]